MSEKFTSKSELSLHVLSGGGGGGVAGVLEFQLIIASELDLQNLRELRKGVGKGREIPLIPLI